MKRFQHYTQNQLFMFPLDIGQLIGEAHLVRIISRFVDGLSSQLLEKPFEKEGKPPFLWMGRKWQPMLTNIPMYGRKMQIVIKDN